ncbi:MAG: hypothetical protein ACRCX8_09865 [Sarcina sp.]
MDISTIESLVGNLGFSLVACGFMGFFIWKIWERFQASNTEVTKTLVEVNTTNKELAHTNKMLVENFKSDMLEIKKDVQDIKERVSR